MPPDAPSIETTHKLIELPPRTCCVVTDVESDPDLKRLKSMGICLGRSLEVVKGGDPLIVKVYGTRIGLSARLAEHVRVRPCEVSLRCWEREVGHG